MVIYGHLGSFGKLGVGWLTSRWVSHRFEGQMFNDTPCYCGIDPLDNNTRLKVFGARITVSHQTKRFLRKSAGEICENLRETQHASGFAQILHRFFAQILHRFDGQIFRYAQDDNPH